MCCFLLSRNVINHTSFIDFLNTINPVCDNDFVAYYLYTEMSPEEDRLHTKKAFSFVVVVVVVVEKTNVIHIMK